MIARLASIALAGVLAIGLAGAGVGCARNGLGGYDMPTFLPKIFRR